MRAPPAPLPSQGPAPIARGDDRPDLDAGPALRVPEADAPDHLPGRLLDDDPRAVPAQVPVAAQHRERPPRAGPACGGVPAQEANDVGVLVDRDQRIEVGGLRQAQEQAIRFAGPESIT